MTHHHDLVDTTEMYLKSVFELEEEGIVPLRARIVERLQQSGPTVSQTVARMERDGLLTVADDRHLELTDEGRAYAVRVMRKHRLVECLLIDVIGLDWELVHDEACRWEHVVSEDVERRLVQVLDHPTSSPYGNPIPGLAELGEESSVEAFMAGVETLDKLMADSGGAEVHAVVRRISEPLQTKPELLAIFRDAGVLPGRTVAVAADEDRPGTLRLAGETDSGAVARLPEADAAHVFVARVGPAAAAGA